jgi:hypothetical protein
MPYANIELHRERLNARQRERDVLRKEERKQYDRGRSCDPEQKMRKNEVRRRAWAKRMAAMSDAERKAYRTKYNEARNNRERNNINFGLACRIRKRLLDALKAKNNRPDCSAVRHLGCSIPEFRAYIEEQFLDGMSWERRSEWHLDHRRPLASFNLTDTEQCRIACHYTNYQPLWAKQNLKKAASWVGLDG